MSCYDKTRRSANHIMWGRQTRQLGGIGNGIEPGSPIRLNYHSQDRAPMVVRVHAGTASALTIVTNSSRDPSRLDLSGLQSATAEGGRALRSLSATGVKFVGALPYVRQLLDNRSS